MDKVLVWWTKDFKLRKETPRRVTAHNRSDRLILQVDILLKFQTHECEVCYKSNETSSLKNSFANIFTNYCDSLQISLLLKQTSIQTFPPILEEVLICEAVLVGHSLLDYVNRITTMTSQVVFKICAPRAETRSIRWVQDHCNVLFRQNLAVWQGALSGCNIQVPAMSERTWRVLFAAIQDF